jgi:hypothetical protein
MEKVGAESAPMIRTSVVKTIRFTDSAGALLWEEPMRYSRLFAYGDSVCEKRVVYRVAGVSIEAEVQLVKLLKERNE